MYIYIYIYIYIYRKIRLIRSLVYNSPLQIYIPEICNPVNILNIIPPSIYGPPPPTTPHPLQIQANQVCQVSRPNIKTSSLLKCHSSSSVFMHFANFQHISHLARREKCRNASLIRELFLCQYICPGRINGISRYICYMYI